MAVRKWKVRGEITSHREVVVRTVVMTLGVIVVADLIDLVANLFFAPWQIVRSAIQTTLITAVLGAFVIYTHARNNLKLYEMKTYLAQLSEMDSLTGLLNRRAFIDIAERGRLPDTKYVLILVDIDKFKAVNDQFGHPAGDAVIEGVGLLLKEIFSANVPVARLGGEEFSALLLPESLDAAVLHAEQFRERVEAHVFMAGTTPFSIRVSVGLADFTFHQTFEEVYSRADQAMYAAKRQGGNKICVFKQDIDKVPVL